MEYYKKFHNEFRTVETNKSKKVRRVGGVNNRDLYNHLA